jgi:hypothetical protein
MIGPACPVLYPFFPTGLIDLHTLHRRYQILIDFDVGFHLQRVL